MEFMRLSKLSATLNCSYQPGVDSPYSKLIIVWRQKFVWYPIVAYLLSHSSIYLSWTSRLVFYDFSSLFSLIFHAQLLLSCFLINFTLTCTTIFPKKSLKFPNFYFTENIVPSSSIELDTLALPHTEWSSCEICGEVIDVNQHNQRHSKHTCKQALNVLACGVRTTVNELPDSTAVSRNS